MPAADAELAQTLASVTATEGDSVTAPDAPEPAETSEPSEAPVVFESDPVLAIAVDVARDALLEVIPAEQVGRHVGHRVEGERVLSMLFENRLPGYPGWFWNVTIARVDADAEPNVLEISLIPADGALLSPEWVPWSDRLADYRASQAAAAAAEAELAALHADDDDHDDDDDDDDEEFDENGRRVHGGDIDGVDVDQVQDEDDDSDDDDDEHDEDDDEEEEDDDDGDDDDDDDEDDNDDEEDEADDESDEHDLPLAASSPGARRARHATGDDDIYGDLVDDDDDEGPASFR
ncbi:DUF3027 domain-containing protein [Mycetocola tolaasinivorans]|uniref:DUF3027 domain-containing protein n=1 Tax=Mycetocola tolaasinivorans TaxID=76635 RepID=A0A3L7ABH3_9MICO|nr:DUF3027 domain-containing protein [Mycetocola tolaasinivorans]